ncbi:pyridoxal kinase PdxY [Flammeovirga sp. EKP202]|uniref:pyridoxal kinase PdxY n=1 Tax=Flammeovirga sp. EKP202 TaxID=2770592 RepID=UPI00165EBF49|nr:pyridoxal kinase PdxY [Flammeovirga sp. EKP202]MBD0400344.1 pyridoxal kinase PdxY [Flammeovirga sp. EKP202]
MKNILSIQSHVTYGHVGNSAAVFPLQYSGFEVWPLNTVQFSGHTQYDGWKGDVFSGEHLRSVLEGVFRHTPKSSCDAILAGYLGSKDTGNIVYEIVADIKKENPDALFCCDTVMGDVEAGFYISEEVPPLYKNKIIEVADIITPNQFESEYLSDQKIKTLDDAKQVARLLHAKGPKLVYLTSLKIEETPSGHLTVLLFDGKNHFIIHNPIIEMGEVYGTGDLFAALTLANILNGFPANKALERTISSMYQLIQATAEKKRLELDLIGSRKFFEPNSILFEAIQL